MSRRSQGRVWFKYVTLAFGLSVALYSTGCNAPLLYHQRQPFYENTSNGAPTTTQITAMLDRAEFDAALAAADQRLEAGGMGSRTREHCVRLRATAQRWIDAIQIRPAAQDLALDRMEVRTDEIDRIGLSLHAWCWDDLEGTASAKTSGTRMTVFIGNEEGSPDPLLGITFVWSGDAWLLIDQVTVAADDLRFDFAGRFNRELGSDVEEILHQEATDHHIAMLRAVIDSESATIRFRGDRGYHDLAVTDADRLIYEDMLTAFEALGGDAQ